MAQSGREVSDFCALMRSDELGRLKLTASQNRLFDEGTDLFDPQATISLQAPSVSLGRVLESASLKGDVQRKVLLSYLLAKAAWQFYESDWMVTAWTKDTVHFMRKRYDGLQYKAMLDQRPFISAEFGTPTSSGEQRAIPEGRSHMYPKILALGIMLLEIELEAGLETRFEDMHTDSNGRERPNARHIAAAKILNSKEWKENPRILKPVRQAIEICITPNTSILGTDPLLVRENLYKRVVQPFSALFEWMWDNPPENLDLGPMKFNGNGTFLHVTHEVPVARGLSTEQPSGVYPPTMSQSVDEASLLSARSRVPTSLYCSLLRLNCF
jgi:hypothetical protein